MSKETVVKKTAYDFKVLDKDQQVIICSGELMEADAQIAERAVFEKLVTNPAMKAKVKAAGCDAKECRILLRSFQG